MKTDSEYIVQFSSLPKGLHEFEFAITDEFFSLIDDSEIQKGSLSLSLSLEKHDYMLLFTFNHKGTVELQCDRCLDNYIQEISGCNKLIVKFGEERKESTDEEIFLLETDNWIDISHYIYEYIILSLPYRRMHSDIGQCDSDVIARIKCHDCEDKIDPRWDALKKLSNN